MIPMMIPRAVSTLAQAPVWRALQKTAALQTTYLNGSRPIILSYCERNFVSSPLFMAEAGDGVTITNTAALKSNGLEKENSKNASACAEGYTPLDDEDEEEVEEMFVSPDPSLKLDGSMKEWGGPRRGGTLAEPTRFGDWERKGRCTDF